MRNRIIGFIIVLGVLLHLFAGTCVMLGTFVFDRGPEIIKIITTSPTGAPYTAESLIAELAFDLVPITWVPDIIDGALSKAPTFGMSTFSKIPRLLRTLDNSYTAESLSISFDTRNLDWIDDWIDEHYSNIPEADRPYPYINIKFSDRNYDVRIYMGEFRTFFVSPEVTYYVTSARADALSSIGQPVGSFFIHLRDYSFPVMLKDKSSFKPFTLFLVPTDQVIYTFSYQDADT